MALGDLVTANYQIEYNGLLLASTNGFDVEEFTGLLGHVIRSDSVTRFGRHGGTGGRHYAEMKKSSIKMRVRPTTDSDYAVKRQAIGDAFAPIVDPADSLYLVTQLPAASATKFITACRPNGINMPLVRDTALGYTPVTLHLEHLDPRLYTLAQTVQSFTMPSDTRTITNTGNADAPWTITIAGPATNPVILNNTTGQKIAFESLVLNGTQTLVVDSSTSTARVNGESVDVYVATGFSWWNFDPGATSITVSATTATTAACTLTTRSAYWVI